MATVGVKGLSSCTPSVGSLCVDNVIDAVAAWCPVSYSDAGREWRWQEALGRCTRRATQSSLQKQNPRQIGLYMMLGRLVVQVFLMSNVVCCAYWCCTSV